jgi:hypothetical protein
MKFYQLMLVFMLATVMSGCTASIESRQSYDSRTDFSGLNSYAWAHLDEAIFSAPESTKHYLMIMDNVLAAKGFKLNPEAPGFLIKTHFVGTYVEEYKTIYGNVEFSKSMLRINFLNPSTNEVIYESAASAHVDENANQASKNVIIDKAVEALLSDFPPGR